MSAGNLLEILLVRPWDMWTPIVCNWSPAADAAKWCALHDAGWRWQLWSSPWFTVCCV